MAADESHTRKGRPYKSTKDVHITLLGAIKVVHGTECNERRDRFTFGKRCRTSAAPVVLWFPPSMAHVGTMQLLRNLVHTLR